MELPEEIKKRVIYRKVPKEDKILPVDITYDPQPCPDCGKIVTNRTIHHKVYFSPVSHWRTQCLQCKKFRHPVDKTYSIATNQIQVFFSKFLKNFVK